MPTVNIPMVSLCTNNGLYYLTAVNMGGEGGPDQGPETVALHTNAPIATGIGDYEKFRLIITNGGPPLVRGTTNFALQTHHGHFLTAVSGGGIGGPNDGTCPVHTDAKQVGAWETFTMLLDTDTDPPTAVFQMPDGLHFLTAVNGGGIGTPVSPPSPVVTTTGAITSTETFTLSTPYSHFIITVRDRATNGLILDAVCETQDQPFFYGPILEGNSYVVGLTGNTRMAWTAPGYSEVTFEAQPGNPEGGLGITLHLDYAAPLR